MKVSFVQTLVSLSFNSFVYEDTSQKERMDITKLNNYLSNPATVMIIDENAPQGTRSHVIKLLKTPQIIAEIKRQIPTVTLASLLDEDVLKEVPEDKKEKLRGTSQNALIHQLAMITIGKWLAEEIEKKEETSAENLNLHNEDLNLLNEDLNLLNENWNMAKNQLDKQQEREKKVVHCLEARIKCLEDKVKNDETRIQGLERDLQDVNQEFVDFKQSFQLLTICPNPRDHVGKKDCGLFRCKCFRSTES